MNRLSEVGIDSIRNYDTYENLYRQFVKREYANNAEADLIRTLEHEGEKVFGGESFTFSIAMDAEKVIGNASSLVFYFSVDFLEETKEPEIMYSYFEV